jgi:Arc/MetJ-type ribon-helix-helix transcriptional regulator
MPLLSDLSCNTVPFMPKEATHAPEPDIAANGDLDRSKMRPVRVAMPARLVREMDLAIQSGAGGYGSRQEFITEAVENHLVDVRYGGDQAPEDAQGLGAGKRPSQLARTGRSPKRGLEPGQELTPEDVRISVPNGVTPITNELAVVPAGEPLYGFHNRDIPTIWALERLAEHGPEEIDAFYERTTAEASAIAEGLSAWEDQHGVKVTALLPKRGKRSRASAEGRTFQNFALGSVSRKSDGGGRLCSGPFFVWGVAGLREENDQTLIGVSERGTRLLEKLQGLSFDRPHAPSHTRSFLDFLGEWAPDDRWGFSLCLAAIREQVDRAGLTAKFRTGLRRDYKGVEWKESVANSIAQGYLGRSREWGLVHPGRGEYRLTPLGEEIP